MYGYVEGYSDTNDISYCIRCGAEIGTGHGDGSVTCGKCGCRFFAVEHENSKEFTENREDENQ